MTTHCPTAVMSNGLEMPLLGCRTFFVDSDSSKLRELLRIALDVGYRHIDTACFYRNEAIIGEVLQEFYDAGKLKREDVFITTKLSIFSDEEADVAELFEGQLKALRTDYIDLYLFHIPVLHKIASDVEAVRQSHRLPGQLFEDEIPLLETWSFMETLYNAGKVKAIGLSNFDKSQIDAICTHAKIKPHNLQTEIHVFWPQDELVAYCQKHGITVTTFSPFGAPGHPDELDVFDAPDSDIFDHPFVVSIAAKHHKTPAQVLLRQLFQRGIAAIPKSVTPENMIENFNIFDFKLDVEDLAKLDNVGPPLKLFTNTFGAPVFNNIPDESAVY